MSELINQVNKIREDVSPPGHSAESTTKTADTQVEKKSELSSSEVKGHDQVLTFDHHAWQRLGFKLHTFNRKSNAPSQEQNQTDV